MTLCWFCCQKGLDSVQSSKREFKGAWGRDLKRGLKGGLRGSFEGELKEGFRGASKGDLKSLRRTSKGGFEGGFSFEGDSED